MDSSILDQISLQMLRLYVVRYVNLAGLTILVYDTLIMLPSELEVVWLPLLDRKSWQFGRNRSKSASSSRLAFTLPRLLLLVARYSMIIVGSVFLTSLIPPYDLGTRWCRTLVPAMFALDTIMEFVGSNVVIYRLYRLCEMRRGTALYIFLGCYLYLAAGAIALAFAMIGTATGSIAFVQFGSITACQIDTVPPFALASWVAALFIDLCAFTLLIWNALWKPRLQSQRLLGILFKDGAFFFLTLIVMRCTNVVLFSIRDPTFSYDVVFFSGLVVTAVSCRALLGLLRSGEKEQLERGFRSDWRCERGSEWDIAL